MLDAYTIKKMLPRLILAIILVNLSWVLCTLLLHYSNVLGDSIGEILLAPFGGLDSDTVGSLSGGQQTATATLLFAGIGGIAIFSSWAIVVPVLLSALFSLLVGYFTLIFRQVLIVMMILIAPIAIALWVLPGTEGWAKKWFSLYMKLLAMYPLIIALLVSGRIVAKIANTEDDLITRLIAIVAVFIPYFMIPFAFRFLGGAIATLGGFFNDRQKGLIDSSRKWAATKGAQNRDRGINRWQLQKRSEYAGRLQDRSSKSKGAIGRFAYRRLGSTIGGYNVEAAMSARNAQEAKIIQDQIATGRDDEIRGLTVNRARVNDHNTARFTRSETDEYGNKTNYYNVDGREVSEAEVDASSSVLGKIKENGTRQYKSLGGAWVNEAAVNEGHRRWGNNQFAQQAALSYEMRKAMTNEQVQGISDRYMGWAKADLGLTERQAQGNWIGAAFENQNQHIEYKNTDQNYSTSTAKLNIPKFVDEIHEKKGSYPLAQMSAHTVTQLRNAYERGDPATQQKIKEITETFVQRGGARDIRDDQGEFAGVAQTEGGPRAPQVYSSGAAHVAEEMKGLARDVGIQIPED
jgi:hypothetical protein